AAPCVFHDTDDRVPGVIGPVSDADLSTDDPGEAVGGKRLVHHRDVSRAPPIGRLDPPPRDDTPPHRPERIGRDGADGRRRRPLPPAWTHQTLRPEAHQHTRTPETDRVEPPIA